MGEFAVRFGEPFTIGLAVEVDMMEKGVTVFVEFVILIAGLEFAVFVSAHLNLEKEWLFERQV